MIKLNNDITNIELMFATENIESNLRLAYDVTGGDVTKNDGDEFYHHLITAEGNTVLGLINLTFYVTAFGSNGVVNMTLQQLCYELKLTNKELRQQREMLFNAVQNVLPNFQEILGQLYGFTPTNSRVARNSDSGSNLDSTTTITNTRRTKQNNLDDNKLINDHWDYVGDLIEVIDPEKDDYPKSALEFMYKSAFKHGIRHGKEMCGVNVNGYK